MKRTFKILSFLLIFMMSFGVVNAFAKGKVLSNDKFYAEIPENFEISDYDDAHYCFENQENISETIEIYVMGNLIFPDGIEKTETELIEKRFKKVIYEEDTAQLEIKKIEKEELNGLKVCYIYGIIKNRLVEEYIHAYIFTTKETLYVISTIDYTEENKDSEKEPEYFKEFANNFLVNGTYYNEEKLTKTHDFSKSEHYIDALERDVLTEDYEKYNSGLDSFVTIFVFTAFALPIILIILFVHYIKTRKKLKEYKEFFGSIEQARMAMRQHYMQNSSYQPMQNNGGYYTNVPNMNAYNNQPPVSHPQYQPNQPAQTNLPPEMQENQNKNENKF